MSSTSALTGQKALQWLFRAIEFGCSIVVLGIHSYYIATMIKHSIDIPISVKAVEGISGVGALYTFLGILFVCCIAGHPAPSFISMIFDISLAGAFIYVAVANRGGASSCTGSSVDTFYGSGDANAAPGNGLPIFQFACKMEMACLIVSCIASLFFILSIFLEIHINRTRYRLSRPLRDADGEYISKSGHLGMPPQRRDKKYFLGLGRHNKAAAAPVITNPDHLPPHQQLSDMHERHVPVAEWGEVSSLHDSDRLYFNDGASRDEHGPPPPVRMTSTTAPQPAAGVVNEGRAVDDLEYGLYYPDEGQQQQWQETPLVRGQGLTETGKNHKESKAAKMERLAGA
ncbi:hypothetical protein B0H63DRAFT_538286 [Podospora didyma]|uniref:MARVEL domain-containing protein n=1 Tax=Podospora didyma TaxID=330526 RepID=A0AAE0U423_9PEZI|nr:hypothetical protein B0H63DRAFT_538286 [Podospora didyma]